MSLVNDMLRDLNKRSPVSNKAARVHGAINSSVESKRPKKIRAGLILAGGLLAGLGVGYFYFQSMGVQVVQVPLAITPRGPTAISPLVEQSIPEAAPFATSQVAAAPAVNAADTPAFENIAEIRELALQPDGFTLLIETSAATTFDIRERSANGLTLHLSGIDRYDRAGTTVPGMSLVLVSDGLEIGFELNEAADFLVREDTETANFDILLSATYRADDLSAAAIPLEVEASTSAPEIAVIPSLESRATNLASQQSASTESSSAERPSRVNRELSLEDQDRAQSQAAVRMVQSGRIVDAYRELQAFLEANPAAHQSRETLATLLLAQSEFDQARVVVDVGLAQVPNFAPFKKIKARLLMAARDPVPALALMREVPPSVTADTEYHELLASLYQQNNAHADAIATYQALLRTNAQQGRWWVGLGISLEAQDKNADARASYQAALQTEGLDAGLRQYIQNRIGNLDTP